MTCFAGALRSLVGASERRVRAQVSDEEIMRRMVLGCEFASLIQRGSDIGVSELSVQEQLSNGEVSQAVDSDMVCGETKKLSLLERVATARISDETTADCLGGACLEDEP